MINYNDEKILTFYPLLVPYVYKIILGLTNFVLYCNVTEPIDIKGSKKSIASVAFDSDLTFFIKF